MVKEPKTMTTRTHLMLCCFALALLTSCGGGGGDPAEVGTVQSQTITSREFGTHYPISIYIPASKLGVSKDLPTLYALDGETWFQYLVNMVQSERLAVNIVAIHTAGQRSRDFVPFNTCTPNGGGHVQYFNFLRQELLPAIEQSLGTRADKRILFGHSHGASLALYGLFTETPGQHSFKAYLASDSSVACLGGAAYEWEAAYFAQHKSLPVQLHFSYATQGNFQANVLYSDQLRSRQYANLNAVYPSFVGTHSGIVPQVFSDGLKFALTQFN
jgi:hypothetical protein